MSSPLVRAHWPSGLALVALLLLPSGAVPAAVRAQGALVSPDASEPLSAEARRIANDVPDEDTEDPGEHYPVSNEWRHDLFMTHVRDLGGAFVGVGTDQCYTIAASQNASMLWVVDIDPLVPLVHRMYGVLVPLSDDPDALVARFAAEHAESTEALLAEGLAGTPDLEPILRAYARNRARMHLYLTRVRRNRRGGALASWLSDPRLYARVRALHRAGRVVARNGDVTADDGALRAVGRSATRLGVTMRVVYFSNAEQFFRYDAPFRANLEALPVDDASLVLRSFRHRGATYPTGDRWHYVVQPVSDMRARIAENGYRTSRQLVMDLMAREGRFLGDDGSSVLDARVPRRFDLPTD